VVDLALHAGFTVDHRHSASSPTAAAVAPGGTLLIVGHDTTNLTEGTGGPQVAAVLFSPRDVLADLAGLTDLVVQKAERVRRPVPDTDRDAIDALVRMRRETPAGSEKGERKRIGGELIAYSSIALGTQRV
jgi:hypothetical protein